MRSLYCEFYRKNSSKLSRELKILALIKAARIKIRVRVVWGLTQFCLCVALVHDVVAELGDHLLRVSELVPVQLR